MLLSINEIIVPTPVFYCVMALINLPTLSVNVNSSTHSRYGRHSHIPINSSPTFCFVLTADLPNSVLACLILYSLSVCSCLVERLCVNYMQMSKYV